MTDQLKLSGIADQTAGDPLVVGKAEGERLAQTIAQMKAMVSVLEPTSTTFMEICLLLLQVKTEHLHYFRGPIVVGKSAWADMLPDWLLQAVRQERFEQILDEFEQGTITERVTPAEIVCALQPFTLEAPLHRDYADLVLWAFDQVLQRHNRLPTGYASFFEMNGDRPIPFERVERTYRELGMDMRRKIIRMAPKQQRKVTNPEPSVLEISPDSLQVSLFD
jgi:hypothetical protein